MLQRSVNCVRRRKVTLSGWFSLFLLVPYAGFAAKPQPGAQTLTRTEKWVMARLAEGEEADLNYLESGKTLSNSFVENLLAGTLPGFKPHRNGVRIIGAIIDGRITLGAIHIPFDTGFYFCEFSRDVIIAGASFAADIVFEASTFHGDANFNGIEVRGMASFSHTKFESVAIFTSMNIANDFDASNSEFEQLANFSNAKIRGAAYFDQVTFNENARFAGINVDGVLRLDQTSFKRDANFVAIKVGDSVVLREATFTGPVTFNGDVANDFDARNTTFSRDASIHIKCGAMGWLSESTFNRAISFEGSSFHDLILDGSRAKPATTTINLSNTSIRGRFLINDVRVADLVAPFLRVEGSADLRGVVVENSIDLSDADFAKLDVSGVTWPRFGKIYLDGIKFQKIRANKDEATSHAELLRIADNSDYSADLYRKLEEFFTRQGYPDDADHAFIERKRRETQHRHGLQRFFIQGLQQATGYGRSPLMAGIPCALLIVIGCIVFAPEKMEPQTPTDTPRGYNRFWYSLGLFLPFVDLQSVKVWKPKYSRTLLRHYLRIHILCGWIFVPFFLATLTGLIK